MASPLDPRDLQIDESDPNAGIADLEFRRAAFIQKLVIVASYAPDRRRFPPNGARHGSGAIAGSPRATVPPAPQAPPYPDSSPATRRQVGILKGSIRDVHVLDAVDSR
jgi:hypothetical protein